MKTHLLLCMACAAFFSCASSPQGKQTPNMASEKKLIGNDRDEHDCIRSAGYQWSELLKDCIRPFEKGLRLNPVGPSPANGVAYLVFNADSSAVEIFWPADTPHSLLQRQSGTDCWKSGKADGIMVRKEGTGWKISMQGETKFETQP